MIKVEGAPSFAVLTTAMGMVGSVTRLRCTSALQTTSATLVANSLYILTSTQDVYVNQNTTSAYTVSDADTYLPAGIPLIIQTDQTHTIINASQVTTSGNLYCTRMVQPGGV